MDSFTSEHKGIDAAEAAPPALFYQQFAGAVAEYGDKNAVVLNDEALTYRELDEASDLVAGTLAGRGIGKEQVVAIDLGRSVRSIVAIVGVMKAGCAFLALDHSLPDERLNFMTKDCDCKALLDEAYMDALEQMPRATPDPPEPHDLSVIIYTSGSTGAPKGVMIEQQNLAALVSSHGALGMGPGDVMGAFANFCFVASLNDILTPLAIGATVDIVPTEIRKYIDKLAAYYKEHRITITYLPPHMAIKLMEYDADITSLKTLLVGSEAAHDLEKRHYDIRNIYAATELCNFVSSYRIEGPADAYPIGKIKKGILHYILDEAGNPVKEGEKGELCLSGRQITRGYLHNPEKTAEKYVKNPFTRQVPYRTLYKTGDIVLQRPDGNLQFVGRQDWMLKIRGYRVESREVELAMLKYPGVVDSAVVPYQPPKKSNILYGFVIAEKPLDTEDIRAYLKTILPPYMVPSYMVQLEEFPRNNNGKVDKNRLPVPGKG